MAKVSIVTASYNYQDYIKETIESVLKQTILDWEMIIVDDGSTDNSVDVIKSYCEKDKRIKLYQHEGCINKGLAETVKLGVEKSTTDWVIFLESDDTIEPNYIEEKLKVIEQYPDIKFIFNDVNMFGDEKVIDKMYKHHFSKTDLMLNSVHYPANVTNFFNNINIVSTFSAVMLKKEILKNIKWHSVYDSLLDYFLWTQLAPNYDFYYINKKLTNWRMSKKSYINSLSQNDFEKNFLWQLDIYRNLYGEIDSSKTIDFINKSVYKTFKKYRKYKKLFNIFLTSSSVQFLVILLLLYIILGRLSI